MDGLRSAYKQGYAQGAQDHGYDRDTYSDGYEAGMKAGYEVAKKLIEEYEGDEGLYMMFGYYNPCQVIAKYTVEEILARFDLYESASKFKPDSQQA